MTLRDYTEKTELEKKLTAELAEEEAQEAQAAVSSGEPEETIDEERDGELLKIGAECDSLREHLLRARAEFDNYRKRMAREMEHVRRTAAEQLIRELLPVVDNLERALSHADDRDSALGQGVEMVARQLAGVLQAKGVEPIPALGESFNPNVHEALAHQPSDEHPADVITNEYERGYRIGEYVLRPAKVVVSSGPPQAAQEEQTTGQTTTPPRRDAEE